MALQDVGSASGRLMASQDRWFRDWALHGLLQRFLHRNREINAAINAANEA